MEMPRAAVPKPKKKLRHREHGARFARHRGHRGSQDSIISHASEPSFFQNKIAPSVKSSNQPDGPLQTLCRAQRALCPLCNWFGLKLSHDNERGRPISGQFPYRQAAPWRVLGDTSISSFSRVMLIHHGSSALSEFRLAKLRQDLADAGAPVARVTAQFIHVADLADPANPADPASPAAKSLPAAAQDILEKLLTYGPARAQSKIQNPKSKILFVAPRPGTISPWSSKATDIAHICGLTAIKRIERVIAYTFEWHGLAACATALNRKSVV